MRVMRIRTRINISNDNNIKYTKGGFYKFVRDDFEECFE